MTVRGLALLLGLLTSCAPLPESYPVPEQRPQRDGPEPAPLAGWVAIADPRAPDYLLEGFLPPGPGQSWVWTSDKATVRVRISDTKNLRMRVHFALPDQSHGPLLPITIRYFVNDRLLDTVVYRQTGHLEYRHPVPAEWLVPDQDIRLRMEISPVYIAAADKQKLGLILAEIGLERND